MRWLRILAQLLLLLASFPPTSGLDGFRKDFADWDHDIVVVVTWYNKDISWLHVFPEPITVSLGEVFLDLLFPPFPFSRASLSSRASSQFAILVKGNINSCATIPMEIKHRVDSCRELPNADGREAHSMAWFLYTFYETLPRLMVFAQAR